jgi:tRNA U34 5-methylaminomethyl-2-thiouridine-forming methyltransferase MnmC
VPDIVTTSDGSHTLYVPELNEHYHSMNGAIQESDYIFIKCGLNYSKADPVRIFEVGFGTGLNAFLTAADALVQNRRVLYTTIEKYPLPGSVINALNYKDFVCRKSGYLFDRIHSAKWDITENISRNFTLNKIEGDLLKNKILGSFDIIYYDAFGPDKQPEMWTDDVFEKISGITACNGILVTYSAKGIVKVMLRKYGFHVTRLPGPPGKHHIIRAVKI